MGYSIKQLRELCQDTGPAKNTQSWFGLANRFVSIYFTKLFVATSITPNQITFLSTIIYLVGIGFIASGDKAYGLVGFGLLLLATVFDACDGEVFRFRRFKRGYGDSYVEPLSHDIMYGLMFTAIGYGAYLQTGYAWMLLVGAAASTFKLLFRMTETRFLHGVLGRVELYYGHTDAVKKFNEASSLHRLIYVLYRNTATSTGLLFPLLVTIIFERLDIFIILYGVGYTMLWFGLFGRQIRRFTKISKQTMESNQ
ncbi:MAG: CDP-alcohol phosphatidyltransferase family protein [Patescibacteria group bacterium]